MPLLLNDLRPRYPRPRPLTLREEWAALSARLDAVAECLANPAALRRRFALCQARYEELLAAREPPPPDPPLAESRCALCGGAAEGRPAPIAASLSDGPDNQLPLCPDCRRALAGGDPLAFLAEADRAPSLSLARTYLALLRRYASERGYDERLHLLDLLRLPHPIDLAGLDRNFAFLARYLRSGGRQPAIPS